MRKIQTIEVKNFKTLKDFKIDMSDFVCLIGLNGAGKSSFLQACGLIAAIHTGMVRKWFERHQYKFEDVLTKPIEHNEIEFHITAQIDDLDYRWHCFFQGYTLSSSKEWLEIREQGEKWEQVYFFEDSKIAENSLKIGDKRFEGMLYREKKETFTKEMLEFSQYMASLQVMDKMSPEMLKKKSRKSFPLNMGASGEDLASVLTYMEVCNQRELLKKIKEIFPKVEDLVCDTSPNWYSWSICERYGQNLFYTKANDLNDGMLRVIAILTAKYTREPMICLEEIENGINIEIAKKLMQELVNISKQKQVIVTTHNNLFLNFIDDEVAQNGIKLLYRDHNGYTRCTNYFGSVKAQKLLNYYAAGDVILNYSLIETVKEVIKYDK